MSFTNNQQIDSKPGTCICSCNYYFWMSVAVSILTFLAFPVIQFIYGIDLRSIDTSINGLLVTVADWLLVDGLISVLTGIMAMVIIKNTDTVPNILKIIFNTCVLFLLCWTVFGTAMLFMKLPLVIHGLAIIYNYIMLTIYVAYSVVTIKYRDYTPPITSSSMNEPHANANENV